MLFLSALNWLRTNWRLVAIAAILAASFGSGWYVRGFIAEVAQNKAIAAAVAEKETIERGKYDKEFKRLKAESERRWKSRTANMGVYSVVGDACSDAFVLPEWVRLIQDAYHNGTGE